MLSHCLASTKNLRSNESYISMEILPTVDMIDPPSGFVNCPSLHLLPGCILVTNIGTVQCRA